MGGCWSVAEGEFAAMSSVSANEISVVVAGGSPLWRVGLVAAIQQDGRLQLAAQSPELRDGMWRALQLGADVLILFTEESLGSIVALWDQFRPSHSQTRLLLLRAQADQADIAMALRSGPAGYGIVNTLTPEDFTDGIVALARDGAWLCPQTRLLSVPSLPQESFRVG